MTTGTHLLVPMDAAVDIRRLRHEELEQNLREGGLAVCSPNYLSQSDMLVTRVGALWVGLTFQCLDCGVAMLFQRISRLQRSRGILFRSDSDRFADRGGVEIERMWLFDMVWKDGTNEPLRDLWSQSSLHQWVVEMDEYGNADERRLWGLLVLDIDLFSMAAGHPEFVLSL